VAPKEAHLKTQVVGLGLVLFPLSQSRLEETSMVSLAVLHVCISEKQHVP
jgi:hypothetical protein